MAGCTGSQIRCCLSLPFDRPCRGRRRCCKSTRSSANRFARPIADRISYHVHNANLSAKQTHTKSQRSAHAATQRNYRLDRNYRVTRDQSDRGNIGTCCPLLSIWTLSVHTASAGTRAPFDQAFSSRRQDNRPCLVTRSAGSLEFFGQLGARRAGQNYRSLTDSMRRAAEPDSISLPSRKTATIEQPSSAMCKC